MTLDAPPAVAAGRICAVAGQGQRDLAGCVERYPDLFGARPFDPGLLSTLSMAAAFSGPWFSADQLRMANRMALWCFALDWLVDHEAKSRDEAAAVADRCRAVAAGAAPEPGDELAAFLAALRDELSAAPAFASLGEVWRDELDRMLAAMVREWEWKSDPAARPTLAGYLDNADNLGFSFVVTAHWIHSGAACEPADLPALRAAAAAVQRAIRLLNDLATYERDLAWGDLNALLLGADRAQVAERTAEMVAAAGAAVDPLRADYPRVAGYLHRQMEFCMGFYGVTDFWGSL